MGTIRFELRKEKKDKEGLAPVRMVYQISGNRKYYNSGQKCYEENWDDKIQQAVYMKVDNKGKKIKGKLLDTEVKKLNGKLADLERDIEKIENRFEANGVIYDVEMVLTELIGTKTPITKRDSSSKELFAFIDKYINDHENLRVKGSLSVYRSLKQHLEGYERRTKTTVAFEKINKSFFQGFQNYLVTLTKKDKDGKQVKQLNNITIAKQLSTLKTFLNYAREHDIEVPTVKFKIKRESDLEVIALTRKEFETIYNLDLRSRAAWDQVRDVFIFSCATGLRYSDLRQLKWEHIRDGKIDLTAIKTGHKTKVPLNPYSRAILKKYENSPTPLLVISNQKSNEHLAKICEYAGINSPVEIVRKHGSDRVANVYLKFELIRMHCGRKTFATLSLERGMSAEYVMEIGSWKDYKSFKRYMNITDESATGAMESAWGAKIIKPKMKAV